MANLAIASPAPAPAAASTRRFDPSSGMATPGDIVIIPSLQSKPELNGCKAKVVSYDAAKGRYTVELSGTDTLMSLKPTNLAIASPAPARAPAPAAASTRRFDLFISHCTTDDSHAVYEKVETFMSAKDKYIFNPTTHLSHVPQINKAAMQEAVRSSKLVVAALSEGFFASSWCAAEVEAARDAAIKVIPCYSGDDHGAKQVDKWVAAYKAHPVFGYVFRENARDVLNKQAYTCTYTYTYTCTYTYTYTCTYIYIYTYIYATCSTSRTQTPSRRPSSTSPTSSKESRILGTRFSTASLKKRSLFCCSSPTRQFA